MHKLRQSFRKYHQVNCIKWILGSILTCGSNSIIAKNDDNKLLANSFWLSGSENSTYFKPNEALEIETPTNFDDEEMNGISVELDSVDITEMIEYKDGMIIYSPLQSMAPDSHELRMTRYEDDGEITELGVWTFNVRMSNLFEKYSVAVDTQLNSNYRVSEKNTGSPLPDKTQSDINSQVGFEVKNGDWHAIGQFDLLYNSVKENRPSDRTVENSEFLLSVGNQFVDAKIGHQNINHSSLVMDNFRRRGLSIESKIPTINSSLTGFSLSSIDIFGFGNGLGISNSQQRVNGYNFSSSPFSESPQILNLSATWISGKGGEGENFISDFDDFQDPNALNPASEKGSAWSFVAESQLLQNKLRVRAEYAETTFDFNPLDSIAAETDIAENYLLSYTDSTGAGVTWNTGVNFQRIGLYFKSLANRGLPSDKQLSKLFGGVQWETIALQFSGEKQSDNLEEIEQLPKTTTELNSINLNWAPQIESADTWLGTPNFTLGYNAQSQLQENIPVDYFFPAANNQLKNWQLSSSFNYQQNSWGLTAMYSSFEDRSGVQNDTDTNSIGLFGNFIVGENGTLSPAIQFDQTTDKITGIDSVGLTYSVQSTFSLVPQELEGNANITFNKNESSDLLTNGENLALSLSLNWNVREANPNQFGVNLTLSGNYNDFVDRIFSLSSLETSQVFLTATFTLPTRIGQED